MSSQVFSSIIAFIAGLVVAGLGGWLNQRIEARKHVAQLASSSFVNLVTAIASCYQSRAAVSKLGDQLSETEKARLQMEIFKAKAEAYAAKTCLAAYGNSTAVRLVASAERRWNGSRDDEITRDLFARAVISLREELGLGKNDVSADDIADLVLGALPGANL